MPFELEVAYNAYLPPGGQDVDAIVSVTATGGDPVGPAAVVFIVDCSASMAGPRMTTARDAVRDAIDALPDGALFAVIAGSDQAEMCYPADAGLVAADDGTRSAAKQAVARLSASGGTAIERWLSLANTVFDDRPTATWHAILLTDGEYTHETPAGLRVVPEAHGVTAYVAADPEELVALTGNATRQVATMALRLVLPRAAEIRFVRQVHPTTLEMAGQVDDAEPRALRYPIGSLGARRRDFHIGIRVPPANVTDEMLAARVLLTAADGEVLAQERITVTWTDEEATSTRTRVAAYLDQAETTAVRELLAGRFDADADLTVVRLGRASDLAREMDLYSPLIRSTEVSGIDPSATEREPVVNTGFALAGRPLSPNETLVAGADYLFWVDIGQLDAYSIEDEPGPLPVELPLFAELTVALFEFEDEIEVAPQDAVARLIPGERVWLPVRIPSSPGVWRLRCGIYWQQVLLESRVVTVHATATEETRSGALRSTVDYRLANPADVEHLLNVPAHTASLFLNDNGDGSHALRVLATDGRELLRTDATFTEAQLSTQIRLARGALRRVAWGTDAPWRDGDDYRYATAATLSRLTGDLASLARNGFRLHHLLLRSLGRASDTGTYAMADRLAAALAKPGVIQVALKDSARHVVPVALLYDLPLDTGADRLTLCEDFAAAWQSGQSLAGQACFRAECRQARDPHDTVVCPGGFWGYRHALGLPVSGARGAALPHDLTVAGDVRLAAGLYRDFRHVEEHCRRLHELLPGVRWRLNDDRDAVLEELRVGTPDVVYFYCHGGVAGDVPYLRVGRGTSGPVITPDNLFSLRIQWPSRPLVFLNGCQTTDLEPERAIDFVSFFVEDASACGVIGTEITVFEEFAREFAEEFLRCFLTEREPIGAAVTNARLALLSKGNPLGLSYIPYALPSIRLVTP